MFRSQFPRSSLAPLTGSLLVAVSVGLPATAASLNAVPFETTASYTVSIPRSGGGSDPASIYYPVLSGSSSTPGKLPIALMLQGALVNQTDYTIFASLVARYGFTVVVPNHVRTLVGPGGVSFSGFFPEQQQVHDVLSFLKLENTNTVSPLAGQLDTSKLGLLGHSFGGAVGLSAVQNTCVPILCVGGYNRPPELKAGVFYGSSFADPRFPATIPPIRNQGVPVALIVGSREGVADLANVAATYAQIQGSPKALVTVLGANHYGITNTDNLIREPVRPTLAQATATETIARWSALFLRANLLGDEAAFDYVFNSGDAQDPNVTVTATVPEFSSVLGLLFMVSTSFFLKRPRSGEATHQPISQDASSGF